MRSRLFCSALSALLLLSSAAAQFRPATLRLNKPGAVEAFTMSTWLDVNRIKIDLTNRGEMAYLTTFQMLGGAFWPDTTKVDAPGTVIVFDAGPCIIGKLSGDPNMAFAQWGTSYSPGPVINGKAAMVAAPADSLRYRLYKINRGDTPAGNPDFAGWPVDLGAPLDANGNPRLLGDQTVWGVFNNLDSSAASGWWQTRMPIPGLPVEIHQAVYAYSPVGGDTSALMANVAFYEWTIINKGTAPIESAYVSLWTDIDFGNAPWNRPAIDTVNQLGYCWQAYDDANGRKAVGFVWLYGPIVPSYGSNAIFKGRPRANVRNLPITSFWGIQDDGGSDPSFKSPAWAIGSAWNIARGFDKMGNTIIDSVTRQPTKFPYSGDPVAGTGWLCPWSSGGAGFSLYSGPFTMAPGDTQWAMAALVPAAAATRFEAVNLLRQYANTLRSKAYGEYFFTSASEPNSNLPSGVRLLQNYPNPFNMGTRIRYVIPQRSYVLLTVLNTLGQRVAVLRDGEQEAGYHEATFDGTGLASGVYFYRLQASDFVQTRRLLFLK